jgi:hypothetical protein
MNRRDITRELNTRYGAFVSVTEVAEYMRKNRSTVRRYLKDVPCVYGRSKMYKSQDIARMITERGKK